LIGCGEIDITSIVLDCVTKKSMLLRSSLTSPENPKLGTVNFTMKITKYYESHDTNSKAVQGRHKTSKKILGTVIMRVLDVQNLKPPVAPQKTRSISLKLRVDKQRETTKVRKKSMHRKS
jgi:hypothetical protein